MEYDVVFDGQLVDGANPDRVKANVAKMFKTDVAKIERLFTTDRTVIKAGVDETAARKYQSAFTKAGAVLVILDGLGIEVTLEADEPPAKEAASEPAPVPSSPPTAEVDSASAESEGETALNRVDLAEAGRAPPPLVARGQPTAPDDMSMAEAGALLVESSANVEAPEFETSHLVLAETGADLSETKPVAAAEFDLSGLELAPPETPFEDTPR